MNRKRIVATNYNMQIYVPGSPAFKRAFIQTLYLGILPLIENSRDFFIKKQREGESIYSSTSGPSLSPNIMLRYEGEQDIGGDRGSVAVFTIQLQDLQPNSENTIMEMVPLVPDQLNVKNLEETPIYLNTLEDQNALEEEAQEKDGISFEIPIM